MTMNPDYFYQNGFDDGAPSENTARMLSQKARKKTCPQCNSKMKYQGFHKTPPHAESVAFAVCTNRNCRHSEEY
jgi:C4-type Zn-finger protein